MERGTSIRESNSPFLQRILRGVNVMKKNKKARIDAAVAPLIPQPSGTDPQGSWTGKPLEEAEIPVQDADDL